ncbi:sensor domain-containing diguanylate cyclase [Brevundimonas kwangchunensis]
MIPSWARSLLARLTGDVEDDLSDPEHLRALVEHSRDVLCRLGPDLCIRYCSPSALSVLGRHPRDMVGQRPSIFVHESDRNIIAEAAIRTMRGEDIEPTTVRVPRPDGVMVWIETSTRVLRDRAGKPSEIILVMRDVSDRHNLRLRLEMEAVTDALTGLSNRRAFDTALRREWGRAARYDSELSLIMIDIDCFKAFNDRYGHAAGDDALRRVGAAIQAVVRRPGDLAVRYGGEELSVILPRTPSIGAERVAHTIRAAVEALSVPHEGSPHGILTVSLGVATAPGRTGRNLTMPDGLLVGADGALYRAKAGGRNRVETIVLLAPHGDRRAA